MLCPKSQRAAREMVERLIEIKASGLVDPVSSLNQFEFMKDDEDALLHASEIKAMHYGEVKLGSERIGDGYILQDGTAGLSENSLAKLLDMNRQSMNAISLHGLPQNLQNFIEADEKLEMFPIKISATYPCKDRKINFYPVSSIELLLRAYSNALIAGALQKNQQHIGQKSIQVQTTLIHSVLASLICEACGLNPKVQQNLEKTFRKDFFTQERQLLSHALRLQNPEMDSKKQQALVAKSFCFGYEDAFTKEEYHGLQGKPYPLHQHIETPQTRTKLSQYLFLLSGQIMVNSHSLSLAREDARNLLQRMS